MSRRLGRTAISASVNHRRRVREYGVPQLRPLDKPAKLRRVNRLTRQEQFVLCVVLGLLLVGLAVKVYRAGRGDAGGVAAAQK